MPRGRSMSSGGVGVNRAVMFTFGIIAVILIVAVVAVMWRPLNLQLYELQDEAQCESAGYTYNETVDECQITLGGEEATEADGYFPIPFSQLLTPGGILMLVLAIAIFGALAFAIIRVTMKT